MCNLSPFPFLIEVWIGQGVIVMPLRVFSAAQHIDLLSAIGYESSTAVDHYLLSLVADTVARPFCSAQFS
jgi:hypothetical protein